MRTGSRTITLGMWLVAAMILCAPNTTVAQEDLRSELVVDVNLGTHPSNPDEFIEFQGDVYFVADSAHYNNRRLYRFRDGQVEQIYGVAHDVTKFDFGRLVVFDDELIFAVENSDQSFELMAFNGSEVYSLSTSFPELPDVRPTYTLQTEGYTVWKDWLLINKFGSLYTYSGSSVSRFDDVWVDQASLFCRRASCPTLRSAEYDGALYFAGNQGVAPLMYRYDGLSVERIDQIDSTFTTYIDGLTTFNDKLYFAAERDSGRELYSFDGTDIQLVLDLNVGSDGSDPANFHVYNNSLVFTAIQAGVYPRLWSLSDSEILTDNGLSFHLPSSRADPRFTEHDGLLYFWARGESALGVELHVFDGSMATLVQDYFPGDGGFNRGWTPELYPFDGSLYFLGWASDSPAGLYKYNGTSILLIDSSHGPAIADVKGTSLGLFFAASRGLQGNEPQYISRDGASVRLAKDINTIPFGTLVNSFVDLGKDVLFASDLGLFSFNKVIIELDDLTRGQFENPAALTEHAGKVYFRASSNSNGSELWEFGESTSAVIDVNPGLADSNPSSMTSFGDDLLFTTFSGVPQFPRLMKYADGLISEVGDGHVLWGQPLIYTDDSSIYYRAFQPDGSGPYALYKYSNGIANQLVELNGPGPIRSIIDFNGDIYFAKGFDTFLSKLWVVRADTIRQVESAKSIDNPGDFVVVGDSLFFFGETPETGKELFVFAEDSVSLVGEVQVGSMGSDPRELTEFDQGLFWSANDGNGHQLWRYAAGKIEMLSEVWDTSTGQAPSVLTVLGDELYYSAFDVEHDREIWRLTKRTRVGIDTEDPVVQHGLIVDSPYPNPANSNITLSISHSSTGELGLSIYNVLGQRVYRRDYLVTSSRKEVTWQLDVHDYPAGIYLVEISGSTGESQTSSFVVVR